VVSALLFSLSALLVFGAMYWASTRFMERQLDNTLVAEMASLEEGGDGDLAGLVNRRLASPSTREFLYALADPSEHRLAGNLPPLPLLEGLQEFPIAEPPTAPDGDERVLRALGKRLADGSFLVVARNIDEIDEVSDFMENSFAIGFAVTLIVAVISGGLVSAGFLRQLDEITRTSREIMAGDLHRRIPTGAGKGYFVGLAVSLNAMLDRIQALMEGVQQVTNDIAHDLRTPLTRLRHRLERARQTGQSVDDLQGAIDGALSETDELLEIFTALLRIAQIESGARRAGFVAVDLSAIAQSIVETYAPVAEDEGHQLTASIQPGISVSGDRQLLIQMLANLVENALRHTPSGSTVTVELCRDGPASPPVLSISDDGPGIALAERDKAFQRFYRLDASRSTAGCGLGLSMVAAIVALHQASIVLDDNAPGLRVGIYF
jgi:signal transduction histidine kinase